MEISGLTVPKETHPFEFLVNVFRDRDIGKYYIAIQRPIIKELYHNYKFEYKMINSIISLVRYGNNKRDICSFDSEREFCQFYPVLTIEKEDAYIFGDFNNICMNCKEKKGIILITGGKILNLNVPNNMNLLEFLQKGNKLKNAGVLIHRSIIKRLHNDYGFEIVNEADMDEDMEYPAKFLVFEPNSYNEWFSIIMIKTEDGILYNNQYEEYEDVICLQ